jgi:hypothetical protein
VRDAEQKAIAAGLCRELPSLAEDESFCVVAERQLAGHPAYQITFAKRRQLPHVWVRWELVRVAGRPYHHGNLRLFGDNDLPRPGNGGFFGCYKKTDLERVLNEVGCGSAFCAKIIDEEQGAQLELVKKTLAAGACKFGGGDTQTIAEADDLFLFHVGHENQRGEYLWVVVSKQNFRWPALPGCKSHPTGKIGTKSFSWNWVCSKRSD